MSAADADRDVDRRRFPPRPALTVVFVCSLAFWVACAAAYATGDARGQEASAAGALMAAGSFAAAAALVVPARTRFAGCALAALSVGALLGCVQAFSMHAQATVWEGAVDEPVEIAFLEDSRDSGFGETALVEARSMTYGSLTATVRISGASPMLCGERVRAKVTFAAIDYARDAFAWREGSAGILKASDVDKVDPPFPLDRLVSARGRIIERIGGADDASALLQALVCGYRRTIDGTRMYAQFQACGLAHLVAVSGAHLVIVTGLIASLLKLLRAPRKLTIMLLIATMASYYVIAGMPVSALRASIMSALGLVSYFGKRRPSSLNAIGIGLFAIIALFPSASVSASLVLSGLSTTGIVVFAPLVSNWLERTPLAHVAMVAESLSLTVSASLLSQLYACSLFSQLPLVSPLANVACAPLFPFVCTAGLVSGLLSGIAPAGLAKLVSEVLAGILAQTVGVLAQLPYASVPFSVDTRVALALTAVASLSLWAWWPRPRMRTVVRFAAVAASLALAILAFHDGSDKIVMLDVGQGDAILVESRGSTLLIDTGNRDSDLLEQLAANHVAHIDSVLVTHADNDHCGSLDALEKAVDVDRVLVAQGMLECAGDSARALVEQAGETARETVGLSCGDGFAVGAFTARVVWPRVFTEEGGNADSICLVLDYDGDDDGRVDVRALMTGDAEKDELRTLIEEGSVGDVDILKVGHHGSRNGMTADELAVLEPEIALISCGANNRYGHPSAEVLAMLEEAGAAIFRTDRNGRITCALSPEGVSMTREFVIE